MFSTYRNYSLVINGIQSKFRINIESISNCFIVKEQNNFINELIQLGKIKNTDKVVFVFKYCFRDN